MLHRPQDRVLFVSPHAKMVDVDSILLKEGQIGIYDTKDTSENGCKAVIDFTGKPRNDKRYEIRIGRNEQAASRSIYDKDFSTPLFSLNEITEIYASWPKKDHAYVDDVILGYNGVSDDTAFSVSKGDRIVIRLILAGRAFELLGYEEGRVEINDAILLDDCDNTPNQCEECDPCEEVDLLPAVLKCIERMKNQPIAGGGKVSDYIDITPVTRCTNEATEPETEDVNFYCMEVCDTGDDLALAEVRAQYPGLKIVRETIEGSMSRYKVMKKGAKPADYTQRLISIMKGCTDCPPNYTEVKGGYLYSISLEDDGVDMSTTVESLPNVVADTVNKMSQIKGSGLYIAATSKKLTDEEISTFVEANPTAIIYYVAKTSDVRILRFVPLLGQLVVLARYPPRSIISRSRMMSAGTVLWRKSNRLSRNWRSLTMVLLRLASIASRQRYILTCCVMSATRCLRDSLPARLRRPTATGCGRNWSRLRSLVLTASAVSVSVARKCCYLHQSA